MRCRGATCGANIVWIPSEDGKPMICNAEPTQGIEDPAGSLRLVLSSGSIAKCRPLKAGEPHWNTVVLEGHTSHWAT